MSVKYVITEYNSRMVGALFEDDNCRKLQLLDKAPMNGRIYVGRVENVVKNLNCAFIEIEKGVKCYYSLNDNKNHIFLNPKNNTNVNIGDKLLIQVSREALKTKPATASCNISLPGELVVLASDGRGVHISSKTKSNPHCKETARLINDTLFPKGADKYGFGFILRTNAANAKAEDVLSEAMKLAGLYESILKTASYSNFLTLLYQPQPSWIESLKNLSLNDLNEIITDDSEVYSCIENTFLKEYVRLYNDDLLPLYKLYSLETHFERALNKKVWLKSGGYLVIEQTEALTVIDVNSGKMIKKNDSVLKTNTEAAVEAARQMSLRNISGIIIIDFVNMNSEDEKQKLIDVLKKEIKRDSVETSFVDITKLGLVELTRKKNGKSLSEAMGGSL
jgi:ribonuclease G